MRPGRPSSLRDLERDHLHQLSGSASENRAAASRTLREARAFQQLAQVGIESGLALPAVSNFHEAARLGVTAVATANGFRFRNTAGAHEAVVDYALALGMVDRGEHGRLDLLRRLRHEVNYPADLIEPSASDLEVIAKLVRKVLDAANAQLPTPKIPPPPSR